MDTLLSHPVYRAPNRPLPNPYGHAGVKTDTTFTRYIGDDDDDDALTKNSEIKTCADEHRHTHAPTRVGHCHTHMLVRVTIRFFSLEYRAKRTIPV